MSREHAVNDLKVIYGILVSDLNQTKELCASSDSQFSRRMMVRAFFAFIEGLAFHLRQVTLASCRTMPNFTPGEIFLLSEKKYQIDDKGNVREGDNYLRTAPGYLFSLRMYSKLHGAEYKPELGRGWDSFRRALAIRDSITHPKSADKLEISAETLAEFIAGAEWGKAVLMAMFDACDAADQYYRSVLNEKA